MRKLIKQRRWKDHLRRRQISELRRQSRVKPPYRAPKQKRVFKELRVPGEFSFIHNAEAMNRLLQTMKSCSKAFHISLDLEGVTLITPEAIAALTATISPSSMPNTTVRGNLPSDPEAKQVLLESGFFDHVKSMTELPKGQFGKITKRKSKRVEPTTARELIECGTLQAFGVKRSSQSTRAAYTTLIESMGNTHNHAAKEGEETRTWWATAYGDSARRRVCYSFLDTGVGIFKSVNLHWIQKTFRKLGLGDNAKLMLRILEGRVESSTGLPYRGKGLPTIYRKSQNGNIKALFIIANDVYADVSNEDYRTLDVPFPGTLLYWESEE
jgi:hypothetical protein